MAEVSIVLNAGTGGASVAGFAASNGWIHQEVVMQTQNGSSDPVSVNPSNPMPVQNVVSLPAGSATIGNVGLSSALPAGANTIGAVTQASGPWSMIGNVAAGNADNAAAGVKISGIYNSTPPSYSTGQRADFQADSAGNLCVNIKAGAAAGGTSSNFAGAFPSTGTAAGASNGTTMQPLLVDGSGNLKVNIVAGGMAAQTDNSVFTAGTGLTLPFSALYNDSVSQPTAGNAGIPRMSLNRQLLVVNQAGVNGGWTPGAYVSAATNNLTLIKGSAGQLGYITGYNDAATPVYLKLFDASSTGGVTMGTTPAVQNFMIPGNTAGAGFVLPIPAGMKFLNGIVFAITGAMSLTDNTSITATSASISYGYA